MPNSLNSSCSTSYVKIFLDNKKEYQACSSKEISTFIHDGNTSNVTIHIMKSGFELDVKISRKI